MTSGTRLPASPHDGSAGAVAEIYAEQVRHLYRLSRPAYPGTLISAGIIVFALRDVIPDMLLMSWFGVVLGVMLARYMLYRAFFRAQPQIATIRSWERHFVIGAGTMGVLWGILGSALYPAQSLPHQFLVIFVIGGIVVSAMVVLAPLRKAFLIFMPPALLPVVITVFMQATALHYAMGMLLIVCAGMMLSTSPYMSRIIWDSLCMKFENSELIARLLEAHERSETANRELSHRMAAQQRTAEQLRRASQKLEALIAASPLAIIVRDTQGRIEKWNTAAERIFGWREGEVLGREVPYLLPGQEEEGLDNRKRILNGEYFSDVEAVRRRKDGTLLNVSISAAPVRDITGNPISYLTMHADVTERRRIEQKQSLQSEITVLLAEAEAAEEVIPKVLQTMCESLDCLYGARWVLDTRDMSLHCVESWCASAPGVEEFRRTSVGRVERLGKPGGVNRRVWATGAPVWLSDLASETTVFRRQPALKAGLHSAFACPILVGGEFYGVLEFFGRHVRPRDEGVLQLVQTISSQIGQFIARKQAERDLQFVANHDALTGLLNRVMFSQRLQQALAQAQRHKRQIAVLFIDLDGFKFINDTLGHDTGDALLVEIAGRLRDSLREGDTIGRMGGDEFVVLIEESSGPGQIMEVARKLLETLARPFMMHGKDLQVTASIGIAVHNQGGRDAQTLIKNADIAMYRAKDQGKNNFQFYSTEMSSHLAEHLSLETSLRQAVERNELALLYQPRIDIGDGRVTGVEALVRWQHPTQGLINPAEFVPFAEDAGLFGMIGDWVLHTACEQARTWQKQELPPLRMSVNLSMSQFRHESLVQRVREALHNAGIEADRLELEITESMLMRNAERAVRQLTQLKGIGVHIALDDFGIGYSSLGYLRRFPLDTVKIDRSLIHDLSGNADAAGVARAVVAMAHSLDLRVTAEGVETREQWEFLRDIGCDEMQGNYFSAAATADAVAGMLGRMGGASRQGNVQQFRSWRTAGNTGSEPES